ncbi:MAG: hypothetical protein JXR94_03665, partial [Candidatus Hydrogenedentes bacterium]|nr:hypothetical protein [Candidatus Hydrogenedentota bacterium]
MCMRRAILICVLAVAAAFPNVAAAGAADAAEQAARYAAPQPRAYNGPYSGANLNRVAFPVGGIGAGMFCIEGTGAISHVSFR